MAIMTGGFLGRLDDRRRVVQESAFVRIENHSLECLEAKHTGLTRLIRLDEGPRLDIETRDLAGRQLGAPTILKFETDATQGRDHELAVVNHAPLFQKAKATR